MRIRKVDSSNKVIQVALPIFNHWLGQVKKHDMGSENLYHCLKKLDIQADTNLINQLLSIENSMECCEKDQQEEFKRTLEELERETFLIDDTLRTFLFSTLEDNDFAACRQLTVLLDINRLVSLFISGLSQDNLEMFEKTIRTFLASISEDEIFRTDALLYLHRIDLLDPAYYPF